MFKVPYIELISHTRKVIFKILQDRFQQYMNFQVYKLDLEKAEEPEIKLSTFSGSWRKPEKSKKKHFYFCFIDYAKVFDCKDHNKLWKILKEIGIPDHFICLLRGMI